MSVHQTSLEIFSTIYLFSKFIWQNIDKLVIYDKLIYARLKDWLGGNGGEYDLFLRGTFVNCYVSVVIFVNYYLYKVYKGKK